MEKECLPKQRQAEGIRSLTSKESSLFYKRLGMNWMTEGNGLIESTILL